MIPLLVHDFNVIAYKIMFNIEKNILKSDNLDLQNDDFIVEYVKASWAVYMNRGSTCCDYFPHTAVITDDNKDIQPYWRSLLFADYKKGRKPKPPHMLTVADYGRRYVNKPGNPFHYFRKAGYEADDFAGAIVYLKRQHQRFPDGDPVVANREIVLFTVDSDWLQLVGEGVVWHNTATYEPRIRDTKEVLEWAYKRFKWTLDNPSEIVDMKMINGDSADNLPKGSPRYLIDLMNSHPAYHLKEDPQVWDRINMVMRDPECNQRMDHYKHATKFFAKHGLPIPN